VDTRHAIRISWSPDECTWTVLFWYKRWWWNSRLFIVLQHPSGMNRDVCLYVCVCAHVCASVHIATNTRKNNYITPLLHIIINGNPPKYLCELFFIRKSSWKLTLSNQILIQAAVSRPKPHYCCNVPIVTILNRNLWSKWLNLCWLPKFKIYS